jgi:hypothetical protein
VTPAQYRRGLAEGLFGASWRGEYYERRGGVERFTRLVLEGMPRREVVAVGKIGCGLLKTTPIAAAVPMSPLSILNPSI